jgi:hypothetical protein
MKHGVLFATVGALAFALTAHAITVDGDVFLSGQTDHTGTLIMFRAVSPSARTDSTHSFNTGYYTLGLQPGVYDVEFSNDGYAPITLQDQVLLFDMTLQTQELMLALSGNLSGTLGPGDFDVVDTIRVPVGDSLRIAPGTRLYFRYRKALVVEGQIVAEGTEQDSVVFTRRQTGSFGDWSGIRLDGADGHFEYCVIERAADGYWGGSVGGGGVTATSSDLEMAHCFLRLNGAYYLGGGIYCGGGTLGLSDCQFFGNREGWQGYGGAVYASGPSVTVTGCAFDSNSSGIYCGGPNTYVTRCKFTRNGQAIQCYEGVYEECVVLEAPQYTYAVHCEGRPTVNRCTIRGGIWCEGGNPTITSSIIAFRDNYYQGVYFSGGDSALVEYCCIYGNAGGNISGNGPPGIGVVALTNANGDSCDTYYNIFLDPQFADTAAGDYHLTLGSPCIDAGDPNLPPDPDATVADMGAFYFNQLGVRENGRIAMRPYALSQNYPNPFNAETRIAFDLARAGEVTLEVFDITGRLVRRLVDARMSEGRHDIGFDARDLPSGVYVYRLAAGDVIEAKKMILIR